MYFPKFLIWVEFQISEEIIHAFKELNNNKTKIMEFPTVPHCQHCMNPWKVGMSALHVSHVTKHLDLKINKVVVTVVLPAKHCSTATNHYTQLFSALIRGGSTFASAFSSLLVHWT